MNGYRIATLYSGSKGNCTFISAGDTSILIDAGKSVKSLCRALNEIGADIDSISAIFITHEHSDHIAALEGICKRRSIPIHITAISAQKLEESFDVELQKNLVKHDVLFSEQVGCMSISSFRTPHDSMMSVGYRIEICNGNEKHVLGLATDIGHVTEDIKIGLCGCEAVVLESNHDTEMLKNGRYPQFLKLRISSKKGHLSNHDSAVFASWLAQNGTCAFILAHLSDENNTPELAFDEINSALSDSSVKICVASQIYPTELI